jgi:DNA polymerase (family 10)
MTGRLLLKRDGYELRQKDVIKAAGELGVIIEINCNPHRLDMDWRWWRKARDRGVLTSLNPDAHRPEQFQFLKFGIGVARKGWLRKEDVLNTFPLEKVKEFLGKPKAERRL